MTDQERDDLRAIQDKLLAIADRRGFTDPNAYLVALLTRKDLTECIWPDYRELFIDILADYR